MAVVFLSQYFMPEAGATSELLSGIAVELVNHGFDISAIAGQPTYFGAATIDKIFKFGGVTVRRVWSTQLNKDTIYGRVLNSGSFAISAFVQLLFLNPRSVVIAVTNPPLLPWICYAGHRLMGLKYVLLIHDVYPDIAISLGALREGAWIARLWRSFNRLSYSAAERIVVLGRDMNEVISQEVDDRMRPRIEVIPNWADGKAIVPVEREQSPTLKDPGMRSRFVVAYSGNIGRFHEIETILDAAARLDDGRFLFLFYGEGKQVELVRRAVGATQNSSVRLMPFQPREKLGVTLTGCDVGLVTLKDGLAGLAVPSKLYGVLASGKPVVVIGPKDCEAARLVADEDCGVVIRPGDGVALADALRALQGDPKTCAYYAMRARRAFERAYDLPAVAERWARLLREFDETAW